MDTQGNSARVLRRFPRHINRLSSRRFPRRAARRASRFAHAMAFAGNQLVDDPGEAQRARACVVAVCVHEIKLRKALAALAQGQWLESTGRELVSDIVLGKPDEFVD